MKGPCIPHNSFVLRKKKKSTVFLHFLWLLTARDHLSTISALSCRMWNVSLSLSHFNNFKVFIILPYIYTQPVISFSCLFGSNSETEKTLWCLCFQRCCFNIAQRWLLGSAKVGSIQTVICTTISVLHKHTNMSWIKMVERTFRPWRKMDK